jgi:hypothetical protein
MGQFTLTWSNTNEISNPNVTGQRASYQARTGGTWATDGFNPANDMAKTITTTISKTLSDNVVYQFKIEAICTVGGTVINDNGVQEAINFTCIDTSVALNSPNYNTVTVGVTGLTGLDITKFDFYLKLGGAGQAGANVATSLGAVVSGGTVATITFSGLNGGTSYELWYAMHATVKGVDVLSTASSQLNGLCGPKTITTQPTPTCSAPTGLGVTAN